MEGLRKMMEGWRKNREKEYYVHSNRWIIPLSFSTTLPGRASRYREKGPRRKAPA
jgi:hypothetical protein